MLSPVAACVKKKKGKKKKKEEINVFHTYSPREL
jgi:hypothetical protein